MVTKESNQETEIVVGIVRQPLPDGKFQWVQFIKDIEHPGGFYLQPRGTYDEASASMRSLEPEKIPVRIKLYSGPHPYTGKEEDKLNEQTKTEDGWVHSFQSSDAAVGEKTPPSPPA